MCDINFKAAQRGFYDFKIKALAIMTAFLSVAVTPVGQFILSFFASQQQKSLSDFVSGFKIESMKMEHVVNHLGDSDSMSFNEDTFCHNGFCGKLSEITTTSGDTLAGADAQEYLSGLCSGQLFCGS